jgi:hypothetical protein
LTRELEADGFTPREIERSKNRIGALEVLFGDADVRLLVASCGFEAEIVDAADRVLVLGLGVISVACPEDQLALKVIRMTEARLADRACAHLLLRAGANVVRVRVLLRERAS